MKEFKIITILILVHFGIYSQNVLFNNTTDISVDHIEQTICGTPTFDGGYIIASSFEEFQEITDSVLLIKYDKLGCEEWHKFHKPYEKLIDGITKYYENSIRQFPDSSYLSLIAINNPIYDDLNSDVGLAKFAPNGEMIWANVYSLEDREEKGQDLLITPDNGAIIVGSSDMWTTENNEQIYQRLGIVIKVDSTGKELWKYIHDERTVFTGVCLDAKNDIVITGSTSVLLDSSSILMKFSQNGDVIMKNFTYKRDANMIGNLTSDIALSKDGGFYCTGRQQYNNNTEAYFVYKVSENFELEWRYFGNRTNNLSSSESIIELDNGETIIGGLKDDPDDEYLQVGWLAKFGQGYRIWEKTYTAPQDGKYFQYNHPIYNIEKTNDNKIFTTGWTTQYIDGAPQINTKLWLMKLDEDGNNMLPLEAAFIPQENNKICLGDSIQLNVLVTSTTGCYQSSWEGENLSVLSDKMAVFKPDSVGVYTFRCTVTDQANQVVELTTEVVVIDPEMLLVTTNPDSIPIGLLYPISNHCGFDWSGTAENYVVCLENNTYFLAPQVGVYDLTISPSDNYPCIQEQSFSLTVVDTMNTAINELAITKTYLFPNPASTNINIQTNFEQSAQIYIYNSQGKLIKTKTINSEDVLTNIEVGQWTTGLYFYQLVSNGVSLQSGKFSVQH